MANPTFRAVGAKTNGSSVTTISVPPPVGHQAGDLLILIVDSYLSAGGQTVATPAGWTLVSDSTGWGTSARHRTYLFSKFAVSSSEPNVSAVQSVAGFPEGMMVAIQGTADTTTPIDATAAAWVPGIGQNITLPAITTITNNTLVVYVGVDTDQTVTWATPPAGTIEEFESSFSNSKFIWADESLSSAAALGTAIYGRASNPGQPYNAFTFAIRPLVSGGGGGLTGNEQLSGGFVRDLYGRLVTVTSPGGALAAGEQISSGFVRDPAGRLMTVASAGGALTAGEQISGGFVRDPVGRLMVVTSGATGYSGGFMRDQAGRLVTSTASGPLGAGEAFSGGYVRDANGLVSLAGPSGGGGTLYPAASLYPSGTLYPSS